jgi:CRP/FNR family transcriptional regulator, cyclic AMP receptor protein
MSVTSLLREIPIFADLDESTLARLAERCVSRTVGAGHALFSTGEECRGLYIVESGSVRIYRTSPEGKEQVLHIEGPGRPVAELALFDGGAYPASATTIEETRLVFLPRADFELLYRTHPDVAETLAFRDVAARVALLLVGYAERAGRDTPAGTVVALKRTQEELAIEIGAARESVSRALKQLRQRGLIQPAGRSHLLIPDLAQLRALIRGEDPTGPARSSSGPR